MDENPNTLFVFYPQEMPNMPQVLRSRPPDVGDIYLVKNVMHAYDEHGWPMWYIEVEWQGRMDG